MAVLDGGGDRRRGSDSFGSEFGDVSVSVTSDPQT